MIFAVNSNRVMGSGTTKSFSPVRVQVRVGTRIDQYLLICNRHNDRQRVGMTVARAPRPKGSGIKQHRSVAALHHDQSAIAKHSGLLRDIRWPALLACLRTQPPQRNFFDVPLRIGKHRLTQHQRSRRQRAASKLCALAIGMEQPPSIIVSQQRKLSVGMKHSREKVRHPRQSGAIFLGNVFQRRVQQEEIERVNVIVS